LESDDLADGFFGVEELAGEEGVAASWIGLGMFSGVVVYEAFDVLLGVWGSRIATFRVMRRQWWSGVMQMDRLCAERRLPWLVA
jgi:hypothetical protein